MRQKNSACRLAERCTLKAPPLLRVRELCDRSRFHQALEIERGVESVISQDAQMPSDRAQEFCDRLLSQAASVDLDEVIDVRISAKYLGNAVLHHPRNFRI